MTDDIFNVGQEVADAMSGSLGDGESVQLPFAHALFWAVNGSPKMKAQGGVSYTGGWNADRNEFETFASQMGINIPETLALETSAGENGEYEVYATRSIAIAPIIYRKRNASRDPGKFRSHIQLLGYGMIATGSSKIVLGPVVLSAKGYQSSNLLKALNAWERASADARREHTGNLDSKFFYVPVGTFGETKFVSVGSAQQSQITPIEAQVPAEITLDVLTGRYVGKEIAAQMASMRGDAKEWMEDWKDNKPAPQAPANFEEESFEFTDDIPF